MIRPAELFGKLVRRHHLLTICGLNNADQFVFERCRNTEIAPRSHRETAVDAERNQFHLLCTGSGFPHVNMIIAAASQ